MKTIVFDGRRFAEDKERALAMRVLGLKTRGVYPKLASIIVGSDPASELYVNLKKKAAERIGAEVDVYKIPAKTKVEDLLSLIKTLNDDNDFQGIMVQMPLPEGEIRSSKSEILNAIALEKDVDGLREDSEYLHPTSKAVIDILHEAEKDKDVRLYFKDSLRSIVVVGATGMVGAPLVKELKKRGFKVIECDAKTPDLKRETLQGDVVISTTGKMNLITADMIKIGAIVIDVGSPFGDVDFEGVKEKSSFITPVPGGVGPVTIACLLENLVSTCM